MSFKNKLAFEIVLAILLVTTLIPVTVEAKEVEANEHMEDNVSQNISCSESSEAEQYWTPERMENAKPLPMTRPGSPKLESQPAPPSNPEVSAPGGSPKEISQPYADE